MEKKIRVGVISDTHGVLWESVLERLKDCDYILHAGDLGGREVVNRLEALAPLCMVRGNNDRSWAIDLPEQRRFTIGGLQFFMVHEKRFVPRDLSEVDIVVYGHSHRWDCQEMGNCLWLNPGSCGRRRFGEGLTMGIMEIQGGRYTIEKIQVEEKR